MENLTIQDKKFISQFREVLFEQKEEFIKGFYQARKVYITFEMIKDTLHLQDYFGHIIFNEFKVSLRNSFSTDDLEKLKVDYEGFEVSLESTFNPKIVISLIE